MRQTTLKPNWKAISLLVIVAVITLCHQMIQNKGSIKPFLIHDVVRLRHAFELFRQKEVKVSVAEVKSFNGDMKFVDYLSKYVKARNKKIDHTLFMNSLLQVSRQNGYDPVFVLAMIETESEFNFNAIGSSGEIGLMQLKPDTAEWICLKYNIPWRGATALKDPVYNIKVGAAYLNYLKKSFKSISLKYINAYNVGRGNMLRMPSAAVQKIPYFDKVVANYKLIYNKLNKIKRARS